jgi:hypothetical protein
VTRTRRIQVRADSIALDGLTVASVSSLSSIASADRVVVSAAPDAAFRQVNEVVSTLVQGQHMTMGLTVAGTDHEVALGRGYRKVGQDPALLIMVVDGGISFKGPGGNVSPGCDGIGGGIAIPRTAGAQDYAAASACMRKLVAAADLRRYHLAVGPRIPFREVEAVLAALRSGGGELIGLRVF